MTNSSLNVGIVTTADISIASYRLRNLVALWGLERAGIPVSLCRFPDKSQNVLFFTKHFRTYDQAIARRAKDNGVKIVFDICNLYPSDSRYYPHYKAMVALADVITTNTLLMGEALFDIYGKKTHTILDSWENVERRPAMLDREPKLVWFGHPKNKDSMDQLIKLGLPYSLELVSLYAKKELRESNRNLIKYTPWTEEAQSNALMECDIVVIPTGNSLEWQVKSNNRFMTALRAGRFVVANPLPAYEELAEFGWVGANIKEGIEWVIYNRKEALARIEAGQDYIRDRYSPKVLGNKWVKFFKEVHKNASG